MAEELQTVWESTTTKDNNLQKNTVLSTTRSESGRIQDVATRIIWLVAGFIIILLAFRFVFSLLGANTTNVIANFVYNVSHPFVAPFFSLFRYNNVSYGVSHIETYTLVAIVFYAVVAWGFAKLVNINHE